jgi:hypothetical protein
MHGLQATIDVVILMRSRASDIGRRRFGRFSGAQSGSALRSVGDLTEMAPTALMKYHLFENALILCLSFHHCMDGFPD